MIAASWTAPCLEGVITEQDLEIQLWGDHPYQWRVWLLLDPFTGTAWAQSHYQEDDPSSFMILEQIAASLWVNMADRDDGEWVWP